MSLVLTGIFQVRYDILLSYETLIAEYMSGIPLVTSNGDNISPSAIESSIRIAINQLETYLDLKLTKQIIHESKDFVSNDWVYWNCIRTSYPCEECFEVKGLIAGSEQMTYPKEWLSTSHQAQGNIANRAVYTIGGSTSANIQGIYYTTSSPFYSLGNHSFIPNYWHVTYVTGFEVVPALISDVVAKLALMAILAVLGDTTYQPGISSQSVSIDGLSQSTSTTASSQGGIYAGRIKLHADEVRATLLDLRAIYKGLMMTVC
jgi:hypothetical protein